LTKIPVKTLNNNLFGKKMSMEAANISKVNNKTHTGKSMGQILAIGLKMSND
jgi:hypothetical protein